jgi:hypothetical protein
MDTFLPWCPKTCAKVGCEWPMDMLKIPLFSSRFAQFSATVLKVDIR